MIEISQLSKSFGTNEVLKSIDLTIQDGEFLVLLGPSGCGKSTLLRTLAGLEKIDKGTVKVGTKVINNVDPQDRDMAMVFQSYALYPHMTVAENIGFALSLQKKSSAEVAKRVQEIGKLLQLDQLLERKPKELSGGQRQRVALGRALARQTSIVLFDEPLSNLDANLRSQMRVEIKRIHDKVKSTMIYVTHDQMEATTMGDRIAVFKDGKIEQIGTPNEIYHHPRNLFIASFIGTPEMNFIEGTIVGKVVGSATGTSSVLGLRPEVLKINLGELGPKEKDLGVYQIELSENLGGELLLHGHLVEDELKQNVRVLVDSSENFSKGQKIKLKTELTRAHLFDKQTGARKAI